MNQDNPQATDRPKSPPRDTRGRPLRDLRISVTDRCNLRCTYCMPAEVYNSDHAFLPRNEILDYEEIAKLARVFAQLGVTKIRLTGGEPLLRRDLIELIAMLKATPGIEDIALTTNGLLLPKHAPDLKAAGLDRLTVSLDAIDDEIFGKMNGLGVPVKSVLDGLAAAEAAGFEKIKINMVVQRGVNDSEIRPMARYFRGSGHILRFIEFMDVGSTNGWALEQVVGGNEIIDLIRLDAEIEPIEANYRGEVAKRWRYVDQPSGEFGLITSVTNTFCGDCSRARLSARGELFTCLFASRGADLREVLRSGASEEQLLRFISNLWSLRDDRYSELRSENTSSDGRVEMSYIGG